MITCAITTFSKKRFYRTIPAIYLFSFGFDSVVGIQFLPSLCMEIIIIDDFFHFMYMSPAPHPDIWWEPESLPISPLIHPGVCQVLSGYDIWHDMTWHDMTWHDMIWHDVTWCDMIYWWLRGTLCRYISICVSMWKKANYTSSVVSFRNYWSWIMMNKMGLSSHKGRYSGHLKLSRVHITWQ